MDVNSLKAAVGGPLRDAGPKNEMSLSRLIEKLSSGSLAVFRFATRDSNAELAKVLWLVKLRWLAVALFFILSIPGLTFSLLDQASMPIYIGIVGVIALFNFFTQTLLTGNQKPVSPLLICFQLAFDLFALWAILLVSGGFANPFVILFLLNASLGGALIPGRLSWPFLLLTHTLLGSLQFEYIAGHFSFDASLLAIVLTSHVMVFSFWVVMRSLGGYLEAQHRLQEKARFISERQDRLRALGALAAGFSHEFASPLNTAKIRLERAMRHQPSEDIIEALQAIQNCEDVIHQMNASQLDTRDFQNKKLNISGLLNDIVDSWKEGNPSALVDIQIDHPESATIPPLTFAQVMLNLLDNAEHAAPSKLILISLKMIGESHELSVKDEGAGFPDAILTKIGEPFVTNKPEGTGLGLYVSQLFAQSLGGELSVANEGLGSCVTIRWPMTKEEYA